MRRINFQNRWRSWDKDELNTLRNEFIKGVPIKEIALKLNRNDDAIAFRLIKIGLLGYPEEKDSQNHGKLWEESEKNQLLKEFKEGDSIEEIAKNHERNKNAILFKLIECRAFDFTSRTELEKYIHKDSIGIVGTIDVDNPYTGGDEIMKYPIMPQNITKPVPIRGSNILTGLPDAISLRNRYQRELDNAYADIVNMVHYIEEESQKFKEVYNKAQGLKQDIKAHEVERADLYDSLGNLLKKETDFEDKMWKTTQKGHKVKTINLKQKFSDSDVDEMNYNNMQEYLKQYPEYASKSSFRKINDKIDQKEGEIRQAKKSYNDAVSKYNYYLSFFEKHIQKAEDKFVTYGTILKEGKEKLDNCRYRKSVFYRLASEEDKAEVNLDTISHRLEQFKNTLKILKGESAQNQKKTFVEMEY